MKRYELTVKTYAPNSKVEKHYFASRKQAFVFVNNTMFMNNKYHYAELIDLKTGEVWLRLIWRGQDNYRRKGV